jgi:peptidoglycan LD-endopeptidase LytH
MSIRACVIYFLTTACSVLAAERLQVVWPTPNTAWAEGKPLAAFIQHAGSGDPESGTFGGVRSGGTQFHEGIDIKCVSRDRHGEPLDPVFAAMTGVVRHISPSAGDSNYGRYIVLEHPDLSPAVYTLYAHLSRIAPGLRIGQTVTAGQAIATMGHSSGGYMIPKDRAHLHFEIGLMITRDFQTWYDRRKFGSRNDHGPWNGMNLMGIDPLAFFNEWRAGRIVTMQDAFTRLPVAVRVRMASRRMPDFIARYPALLTKPPPLGLVAGWEIAFNWTGVPIAWTPLNATETMGMALDQPRIVFVDTAIQRHDRSRTLVVPRHGAWLPGRDLEVVLQQLFAVR